MTTYHLGGPKDLVRQLKVIHNRLPKEANRAMRLAARGSVTAVQMKITAMSNPPVDSGQYLRSFTVKDVENGSELYTSEPYSVIIETGRKPGSRPPPVQEIREWLMRKRLVPRKTKKKKGKKSSKKKQKAGSKGKSIEQRAKKRRKRLQIYKVREANIEGVVRAVVMKIARKGIKGRFPVRQSLPEMRKILAAELKVAMRRTTRPK